MTAIIDTATLDELIASMGTDFIGELIDTYCEETPRLIIELQAALAENQADDFRRAAHSIKSSSATFGALSFAAQARELELIGKAGDLGGAGAKVAALVDNYPPVAAALREQQHAT